MVLIFLFENSAYFFYTHSAWQKSRYAKMTLGHGSNIRSNISNKTKYERNISSATSSQQISGKKNTDSNGVFFSAK